MTTKCFIDMDGVLVDFMSGALKLHNKTFDDINPGVWNAATSFNMSELEFWSPIDADFWADLPPTPQCHELFKLLKDRFGLENLCILSAPPRASKTIPGTMGGSLEGKYRWCQKHIPEIGDQCIFGWHKQFAARQNAVLVDDMYMNIRNFEQAGGKGIMVEYYWNSGWNWKPGDHVIKSVQKQLDKLQKPKLDFSVPEAIKLGPLPPLKEISITPDIDMLSDDIKIVDKGIPSVIYLS